jgi:signal transduction histidine kinase
MSMASNDPAIYAPVYIINDDPIQLAILARILRAGDIPYTAVSSAEEALRNISPAAPPSLIISDLHMPGVDGWRFCRLLRSQEYSFLNHVPILIVSATYAGEHTREITAATGADAFIPAPVNRELFLSTVRGLLAGESLDRHRAKALLVDDSRTIRIILTRAFNNNGYETAAAANAAEARRLFSELRPEIVILDYNLPDATGEDLLREFAAADHFAVLVMITADPAPELALRWMQMGAAAYARKPFETEYVVTLCENAARERVMMRARNLLEQRIKSLSQAQKMAAVGQLAGGVAHDFNNILQVIDGYTEIALSEATELPGIATNLAEISKATDRARRLVEQLLAVSRPQSEKEETIDLSRLLEHEAEMVRRMIGTHIDLDVHIGEGPSTVCAEVFRIEQVILNLCINARDAMPQGGRLTLSLRSFEFDDESGMTHYGLPAGQYVCIEIIDTGCGMTPEVRERVFEPFYTTKGVGKGTGLGLSTAYGIIASCGGSIDVSSEPGRGSTFRVFLPVSRCEDGHGDVVVEEPRAASLIRNGTVLLAEDESDVRKITEYYLVSAGYRVLTAPDGDEAVRILADHGSEVDLLVLDVIMPGLGGNDVLEAVRVHNPTIPAIFISGYTFGRVDDECLPAGARLLRKPYTRDALLRAVADALREG